MLRDDKSALEFDTFMRGSEQRLRQALTSSFGPDIGREATAEALAYAWEHWGRISEMENQLGYLYAVGRNAGRRMARRSRPALPPVDPGRDPWIEPALPAALGRLTKSQQQVVLLLYAYDWSMSEVAAVLGISKGTVQTHAERAMRKLRKRLGVKR